MSTEVLIDWAKTPTKLGVIDSILLQLKAPEWHGRGLDALEDSLVVGNINGTEPPYDFRLQNTKNASEEFQSFQNALVEVFLDCVRKYDGSSITID